MPACSNVVTVSKEVPPTPPVPPPLPSPSELVIVIVSLASGIVSGIGMKKIR